MNKRIYRITDITSATGHHKTTILRWEAQGKIPPARRDGRGWRFYMENEFQQILAFARNLGPQMSANLPPSTNAAPAHNPPPTKHFSPALVFALSASPFSSLLFSFFRRRRVLHRLPLK